MADLVKIDSGQTLSVFQKPGEDTRISTSKSESLFTFGSFRVQRNTDSDSLSADSRHLSFDSYGTLESLNVSTFEPELSFSVDNRELNFKKTDPLSYAYFSSFYTSVAQGINDVNENFPYAVLSYDNGTGSTIVNYTTEKVGSTFESSFSIPYTSATNQGEVVVNSGTSTNPTLVNDTSEFAIQLFGNETIHEIIDYSFTPFATSAGTSYMNFRIGGLLFDSSVTASSYANAIYVRPTKIRHNLFLSRMTRLQKQLVLEGEFLIPSAEEPDTENLLQFPWPRSIDGFNPDNQGGDFTLYLEDILNAAQLVDDSKTGIMLRTMVPENFLEQDSDEGDYRSLVETYSKQFDDIKQFIDSIAFAHTVNYSEEESLPNKFLHKLSNLLGWELSSSFNETDLFEYLVGDVEGDKTTLAEVNVEIWKRILINIIWLFKKKGTRDALQFVFKLIGAPECLINLNEFVYDIKKVVSDSTEGLTGDFAPSEGQTDFIQISDSLIEGGPKKINENGYINYDASSYIFQEGGPGRGDGQAYINQWRPEFDPIKRADNIKVQTGDTNYFGTEHILNTKELDVSISPAAAIECDVMHWLQSTGTCWVWGTTSTTFSFSALTVPFEHIYEFCDVIDYGVISGMTFNEFAEHVYANSTDPRTRKTVDQEHTSFWYQNLKKLYLTYYYGDSPRSNRLTFRSLEFFIELLEVQFQDYFLQLIPATTIFQGTGTEYRNTLFNRQKFVYKEGINDGSEFQADYIPPLDPQLYPVIPTADTNDNNKADLNIIEVKGYLTPRVGMQLNPIQVISNMPTKLDSVLNPISLTSEIYPNTSSDQFDFDPFDFAVIRYKWTSEGGNDLDTKTAIVNTGNVSIDGDEVGWSEGPTTVGPLSTGEPFLTWGTDNSEVTGTESVKINFLQLENDFPLEVSFEIRLRALFQTINSGNISIEMETYLGGEIVRNGHNFINPTGILVDKKIIQTTITNNNYSTGDDVGKIVYDVATKTAQLLEV